MSMMASTNTIYLVRLERGGETIVRLQDNRKAAIDLCYDSSLSWEVNLKRCPKGIEADNWAGFLTYRLKPENQVKIYRLRKMSSTHTTFII
jgi:hypothetical protein